MMKHIHPVQNYGNYEKRPKRPAAQYSFSNGSRPPPTPYHARDRRQQRQHANKAGSERLNLKRFTQFKTQQMRNRPCQSACRARNAEETLQRAKHDACGVRKSHTTNCNAPVKNHAPRIPGLSDTDCGARSNCREHLRHEAAEVSPADSMTGTAFSWAPPPKYASS